MGLWGVKSGVCGFLGFKFLAQLQPPSLYTGMSGARLRVRDFGIYRPRGYQETGLKMKVGSIRGHLST